MVTKGSASAKQGVNHGLILFNSRGRITLSPVTFVNEISSQPIDNKNPGFASRVVGPLSAN